VEISYCCRFICRVGQAERSPTNSGKIGGGTNYCPEERKAAFASRSGILPLGEEKRHLLLFINQPNQPSTNPSRKKIEKNPKITLRGGL
jgi:hypothetical protein